MKTWRALGGLKLSGKWAQVGQGVIPQNDDGQGVLMRKMSNLEGFWTAQSTTQKHRNKNHPLRSDPYHKSEP